MIGTLFKVGKFILENRKGIMRLYHSQIKHHVMVDDLIDWGEEHPDHPKNKGSPKK